MIGEKDGASAGSATAGQSPPDIPGAAAPAIVAPPHDGTPASAAAPAGASASGNAVFSRAVAIGSAVVLVAAYGFAASSTPLEALRAYFLGPFSTAYSLSSLLESAAPLLVCAVGAWLALKAGAVNLGGEGQAAAGCLAAASAVGLIGRGGEVSPFVVLPLALAAAAFAGGLLASLSVAAERWSGADVLLTTFLLSQAALICVDWAIGGPLKDPAANLLAMAPVPGAYRLPRLAPPLPLSAAAPFALVLALGAAYYIEGTRGGYELALYGKGRAFARAVGLPGGIGGSALIASGALCGLAGALLVLGATGRAVKGMTGGVGWNGLAVALVAGGHALGCLPAALFFAWLDAGASKASIAADLSPDAGAVMKAVALLLITARFATPRAFRGLGRAAREGAS